MKIEEIERLAVAATAFEMGRKYPHASGVDAGAWRKMYQRVLAEFIEQNKTERAGKQDEGH